MQSNVYQVGCSFPALDIPNKSYSLEADLVTGWNPKMKVIGPIPLSFDSRVTDLIVDELASFGRKYKERIIYLGYRYSSSFKLQQQIKRNYNFKHDALINTNFSHLAAYFRKFHANFKSKVSRLFRGMNPTLKINQQLIFDSNFESGNLDIAVKVAECQYDVFMRVDTNTRGHNQWFNFTVKNNGKQKVKINIVNFRKHKTLYNRGMKPYIYSDYLDKQQSIGWFQGCRKVKYDIKKLRYTFLEEEIYHEYLLYNCLSFQYEFQSPDQVVQFAYCPPFTYTDNVKMIQSLYKTIEENKQQKEQKQEQQQSIMKQELLIESLGGLDISLLTITDPTVSEKDKKCILISARIHPGQTCGSHMVKGFLQFIISQAPEAQYLRKHIIFKVIPMLNPDGVVVGNFRTSFCGKDLNRMFKQQNTMLIPEVRALKSLAFKLKEKFKAKLMFFIDFHGHSVKKNVFLYGPQYQIWQTNYYKTRILPKLISNKTEIFRYYSCMFRIADFKRATGRAVLLRTIPHCYTIQASVGSYYSPQEKKDFNFTIKAWENMGKIVSQSIQEYFEMLFDEEEAKQQKRNRLKGEKNNNKKQKRSPSKMERKNKKQQSNQNKLQKINQIEKDLFKNLNIQENGTQKSRKARNLLDQIRNEEKTKLQRQMNHEDNESDNFSQGGSDSESPEDDLDDKEIGSLHQNIEASLRQFKDRFYKKNLQKYRDNSLFKPKFSLKFSASQEPTSLPPKRIEMIASLRKKAQKMAEKPQNQKKTAKLNHRLHRNIWKNKSQNLKYSINKTVKFQDYTKLQKLNRSSYVQKIENIFQQCIAKQSSNSQFDFDSSNSIRFKQQEKHQISPIQYRIMEKPFTNGILCLSPRKRFYKKIGQL